MGDNIEATLEDLCRWVVNEATHKDPRREYLEGCDCGLNRVKVRAIAVLLEKTPVR